MRKPPQVCACVKTHTPANSTEVDMHHVLPQSWGGQGDDSTKPGYTRLVPVCPITHRRTHALINLYVRHGRKPTGAEIRNAGESPFNALQRELAAEAWAHKDRPTKPRYTLTQPQDV